MQIDKNNYKSNAVQCIECVLKFDYNSGRASDKNQKHYFIILFMYCVGNFKQVSTVANSDINTKVPFNSFLLTSRSALMDIVNT